MPKINELIMTEVAVSKLVLTVVLGTLLFGCVSFPQSQQALVETGIKTQACFSKSKNEIEPQLRDYLKVCYKPNLNLIGTTSGYYSAQRVKEHKNPDTTVFTVYAPQQSKQNYFLTAQIESGQTGCETQLTLVIWNEMWRPAVRRIQQSIAQGKILSCK